MASILEQYTINTKGLNDGQHVFDFFVDDSFFNAFKNEETNAGALNVEVSVNKEVNTLVMEFNIKGNVKVKCDRCLEPIDMPIEAEETLYFRFGGEFHETDADTIFIPFTQEAVNVAQYIYDFIMLAIPMKRIHPFINGESTCNKEMLSRIENIDKERNKKTDPRWDKLNYLLTKEN